MKKLSAMLIAVLCIAGCETTTQTTSGHDYIAKHPQLQAAESGSFEEKLRQVASVEPTLTFPARIGLARIDGGQLTAVPGDEAQAWQAVRTHLGEGFGEFVPVSPLVTGLALESVKDVPVPTSSNVNPQINSAQVINQIRLGAARQHLDAVLVYEAYSSTDTRSNILSIANLTIIGAFIVPSQLSQTEGYATAMLIDVMQAYPYGTVDVMIDQSTTLSSSWGWGATARRNAADETKTKAVFALAPKVEEMIRKLRVELEAKQGNGI